MIEARLARLEARLYGDGLDDAIGIAAAARLIGLSVSSVRRLARTDPAFARTCHRAPGRASKLIFSRRLLEGWKETRR
jgi:hypothetical protein